MNTLSKENITENQKWFGIYKSEQHHTGNDMIIITENYPRTLFDKIPCAIPSQEKERYYMFRLPNEVYHVKIEFAPLPHSDEHGNIIMLYNKETFTQEKLKMICDDYKENYLMVSQ